MWEDDNVTGFTINGYSYTLNPPSSNDSSPIPQNVTININPIHILLGANTIIVDVNNLGALQVSTPAEIPIGQF